MVAAVPGGLPLFTIACPFDKDSLLMERAREALTDHRVVFNEKYAHDGQRAAGLWRSRRVGRCDRISVS